MQTFDACGNIVAERTSPGGRGARRRWPVPQWDRDDGRERDAFAVSDARRSSCRARDVAHGHRDDGTAPREANCCRTHENSFAIFAGELLGGVAVVLPFDPGNVMQDFRASERYFYADPERLPSERVSRVAKGEVLHLVHSSLAYVHTCGDSLRSIVPDAAGCKNVFAFRIDTDKGTREEIDALDVIAGEYRMAFSWFLDVKSHEDWLSRFRAMEGQEIGLHCYEHRVYLDALKDGANIRRGITAMKAAGLVPRSYAAPFGFWSPDLARIVDEWGLTTLRNSVGHTTRSRTSRHGGCAPENAAGADPPCLHRQLEAGGILDGADEGVLRRGH